MKKYELKSGATITRDDLIEALLQCELLNAMKEVNEYTPIPIPKKAEKDVYECYLDILADDEPIINRKKIIISRLCEAAWLGVIRGNYGGFGQLLNTLDENDRIVFLYDKTEQNAKFDNGCIVLTKTNSILDINTLKEYCKKNPKKKIKIENEQGESFTIVGIEKNEPGVVCLILHTKK